MRLVTAPTAILPLRDPGFPCTGDRLQITTGVLEWNHKHFAEKESLKYTMSVFYYYSIYYSTTLLYELACLYKTSPNTTGALERRLTTTAPPPPPAPGQT